MSMDAFTSRTVAQLRKETDFIHTAMRLGSKIEKRKQGIFSHTCGGAHLIQGAAMGVARGFGTEADREVMKGEIPALFARLDPELKQVDDMIRMQPKYRVILLGQRLKFLGHFVESTHKLAAMGLFEPSEEQEGMMQRALAELVATVAVLKTADGGIFKRMAAIRDAGGEQMYLDFLGDSAHALHGVDLATGHVGVRY
jgi:hypothetical protein